MAPVSTDTPSPNSGVPFAVVTSFSSQCGKSALQSNAVPFPYFFCDIRHMMPIFVPVYVYSIYVELAADVVMIVNV